MSKIGDLLTCFDIVETFDRLLVKTLEFMAVLAAVRAGH